MPRLLWLPLTLLAAAAAPRQTLGPTPLRAKPTPSAKVLQTVPAGTSLEATDERDGWVTVRRPKAPVAFIPSYALTAVVPAPPRPGAPAVAAPSSDAGVLLEQLEAELARERDPQALEARARADKRAP